MNKILETAGRINSKLTKSAVEIPHSVKTPLEVAEKFINKSAAPKNTMTKTQMHKALDRAKEDYQHYNEVLQNLKSQKAILDTKISDADSKFRAARAEMMSLTEYMRALTLSGSKSIVRYQDCDDVGYVRDGIEYHLDINAEGDVKAVPMKEFKKMKKNVVKPEDEDTEELKEEDVEGLFEDEESEDSSDADDVPVGDYYADKVK